MSNPTRQYRSGAWLAVLAVAWAGAAIVGLAWKSSAPSAVSGVEDRHPALIDGEKEPAPEPTSPRRPDGTAAAPADEDGEPTLPPGYGIPIRFDDPSGRSLSAFHDALKRVVEDGDVARVVFFGGSHTAADHYPGYLRKELQARYGDAGRGFSTIAWPSTKHHYWQWGVAIERGRAWARHRLGRERPQPDYYGLAGVVFDSEGRDARAVLRTSKRTVGRSASRIDLYYLAQPGGGELEVRVDGSEPTLVATEAPTPRAGFALLEVDDGPHEIIVEARPGKSVRVYGVSLERTEPGVIVHNLALGGSRARNHLKWRQPVYRQQLEHLAPDLVVFFYGGNEGNDFGVSLARYERNHARALTRFRSAAPEASCLMLGPADKPLRQGNRWVVRDRTVAIARIQERLARRFHCAYFDTLRFMGGPLAMRTWVEAGYARDDYVHFSAAGYRRLGEVLLESLLPSVRARRDEATGRLGRSPAEKRRREGADPHPR